MRNLAQRVAGGDNMNVLVCRSSGCRDGRRGSSRPRRRRGCKARWGLSWNDQVLARMQRCGCGNVVRLHESRGRDAITLCDGIDALAGRDCDRRAAVPAPVAGGTRFAHHRSRAVRDHGLAASRYRRLRSLRGLRLRDRSGRLGMGERREGIVIESRCVTAAAGNPSGDQRQHGCSRQTPRAQHLENARHAPPPVRTRMPS